MFDILIYLLFFWSTETSAARIFAKFWNFSITFQNASETEVNTITMSMPFRAECVSLCVMNAGCCCTQWVPSTNTCTIFMAESWLNLRLSPNPLVISSIDSAIDG